MSKVIFKVGDDLSTDVIYPGRYMATVLPNETPQFAFADEPSFNTLLKSKALSPGGVVVAGNNFGCGSSREQAVSCLKGHELVIVAKSFARIFLQNAVNLGLSVVTCPAVEANEGDALEFSEDKLVNQTTGKRFPILPLPASRQAIIDAGGLINYTRKRLTASTSPSAPAGNAPNPVKPG
jgi:3-isopropylmalate/(R)-2-methylmalate dehydratase small subunit